MLGRVMAPLQAVVWGLVIVYLALGLLMFAAWLSVEGMPRVVAALETRWGWWLPGGLFWKLGRRGDSVGDKWPLFFGPIAYGLHRAGWQYSLRQRELRQAPAQRDM